MEVVTPEKLNLGINHGDIDSCQLSSRARRDVSEIHPVTRNNISRRHKNSTIHQTVIYSTVFVPISLIFPPFSTTLAREEHAHPYPLSLCHLRHGYQKSHTECSGSRVVMCNTSRHDNDFVFVAIIFLRATKC